MGLKTLTATDADEALHADLAANIEAGNARVIGDLTNAKGGTA